MSSLSIMSAHVELMEVDLALVHIPRDLYPLFMQPILQLLFHEVPPVEEPFSAARNADEHRSVSDGGFSPTGLPPTECGSDSSIEKLYEASQPGNFLPSQDSPVEESGNEADHATPIFMNFALTPLECSVMCPRPLADSLFRPVIEQLDQLGSLPDRPSISQEDFVSMQVYGSGLNPSQRVLELTSPLATAGISIFFNSTYFADYIVFPRRCRAEVMTALEDRGFQLENHDDCAVNFNQLQFHSPGPPVSNQSRPRCPVPSTLSEMETRTFAALRKHRVQPSVDQNIQLVSCCAHHRFDRQVSSSMEILRSALTTALLVDNPRFLSLTIAATDPAASLLLEKRLLPRFESEGETDVNAYAETSLLIGSKEDILIPIMLDLSDFSLESTGIVCGLASRLAVATRESEPEFISSGKRPSIVSQSSDSSIGTPNFGFAEHRLSIGHVTSSLHCLQLNPAHSPDPVEVCFLSTARAGTVVVGQRELQRALEALDAESRKPEFRAEDSFNALCDQNQD